MVNRSTTKHTNSNQNGSTIDGKTNGNTPNGHTTTQDEKKQFLSFIPTPVMLPICVIGIYTCYFTYGFLQEEIINKRRIDAVLPLLFQYVIALFISIFVSSIINYSTNAEHEGLKVSEMYVGLLNNFTMLASNYALEFVDYPTQALVKSSKILPVMAFGWFRGVYNHKLYKYICALFITVGLVIFNIAKLGSKVSSMSVNFIGMFLLFVSLFFDGLLNSQSDIEKQKKQRPNAFNLMIANNIVGILSSVVILTFRYSTTGQNLLLEITGDNIYELILIGF